MINCPIKFNPILHQRIWGGEKLKNQFFKNTDLNNVGESWELSSVEGNVSVVANGPLKGKTILELLSEYKEKLVGRKVYDLFPSEFPLLIKFIDAAEDLSVQVHPNDELAKERHNSFGKTEMWYVMDADEGAKLNIGFKEGVQKDTYVSHLENQNLESILNFVEVKSGDSYFIPAGLVHAIGGGCLIAEIQQTSDITYRIYDYNRNGLDGKPRELHSELAKEAIQYAYKSHPVTYDTSENCASNLASCEYFTTNLLKVKGTIEQDLITIDSFIVYICVEGSVNITVNNISEKLQKGEVLLIPACVNSVAIESEFTELLEVYI